MLWQWPSYAHKKTTREQPTKLVIFSQNLFKLSNMKYCWSIAFWWLITRHRIENWYNTHQYKIYGISCKRTSKYIYIFDQHNIMPVSWSYLLFFILCLFKLFLLFFESNFESDFQFNFQTDFESNISNLISNLISNPILNPSIASPSDNLISLSYSMPVFSANLFGLFLKIHVLIKAKSFNKCFGPWGVLDICGGPAK